MLTEAECIAQNRCPFHQSVKIGTCPWKKCQKYKKHSDKVEVKVVEKHDCRAHTTSKESKGWISYSCSCGIRWGKPA